MNEARRVQSMLGVLFVAIAALAIAVGVWLRLTPAPPPTPPAPPREARIYIPKVDAQGELTYESKPVAIQNPDAAYTEVFDAHSRVGRVPQRRAATRRDRSGRYAAAQLLARADPELRRRLGR